MHPAPLVNRAALLREIIVVGLALGALVVAQFTISAEVHGTNFSGGDGKMAQAIILAAQRFSGLFEFNNLNPIQGLGSQLLPINVWLSPVYWPFAVLDKAQAADVSAAVALGVFALACYVMARCFDLPMLPSIIAAQLCIVLFAPILFLLQLSTVFTLMIGHAVVCAPYMVALGLLARIEPGSWRSFGLITSGIFVALFYSLCCDPLWMIVVGSSWAIPFAVIVVAPMRPKGIFVRCAALGCCLVLFAIIGAAEYLYTLPKYTARLAFPMLERLRLPDFTASALFHSPYMKYFYLAWALGWLAGLLTLRGRPRMLVIAGMATCGGLFAEILIYLLLQDVAWSLPLPVYVEQSLFPLFLVSAVAGYWGAVRAWFPSLAGAPATLAVIVLVPAAVAAYAVGRPAHIAELYNEPWPNEPELVRLLVADTAQTTDRTFRGSVLFTLRDYTYATQLTIANLWVHGVPTTSEYDQLVTPQSVYFNATVLGNDVQSTFNTFMPVVGQSRQVFFNVVQMLGARYYVVSSADDLALPDMSYRLLTLPRGAHHNLGSAARWLVLELPRPNLGTYSPTLVTVSDSGAATAAMIAKPSFDFTKHAVLATAVGSPLVPARDMQMSLIRGGLHVVGYSDGTSLVVLPQQFSHCLRARDHRVRLVRANLMLTGVVFSGSLDTDIVFDYGVFAPRCRFGDLSDIKRLGMTIDARARPISDRRLFPDWQGITTKLRAAGLALH